MESWCSVKASMAYLALGPHSTVKEIEAQREKGLYIKGHTACCPVFSFWLSGRVTKQRAIKALACLTLWPAVAALCAKLGNG